LHGASLTKAAFAYVVLQLSDEGRLDLDRPVAELLPRPLHEYERYASLAGDERWRMLTPRMLLSHTGGLPNWRWFLPDRRLRFVFDPGERYNYSGEGMQILQLALEQGLGLDLAAEMQRRVFDRFGMTRSSMTWRSDLASVAATGHLNNGEPAEPIRLDTPLAAGSMSTTLHDYARFWAALTAGEGLSQRSRAEFARTQVPISSVRQFPAPPAQDTPGWRTDAWRSIGLGYGLGVAVYDSPLGRAFFKEGNDDGWSHLAISFPEAGVAVVMMSNSSNANSTFYYLLRDIVGDACLPWFWMGYVPYDQPGFLAAESLAEAPDVCAR
jgi:CubicO group peptidase (beta-lactamase class C family)